MKLIDRYILKELWIPFLLSLIVLTSVLFLSRMISISEILIENNVNWKDAYDVIFSIVLSLLGLSLPLAFLIGILLCFGRMSSESEIIALKGGGISNLRLMLPVIASALLLLGLSYHLHSNVLPNANWQSIESLHKLVQFTPENLIQERTWITGLGDSSLYIQNVNEGHNMEKIAIHQKVGTEALPRVITSEKGSYAYFKEDQMLEFSLIDGRIEEPKSTHSGDLFMNVDFKKYVIRIPLPENAMDAPQKKIYHMTSQELKETLQKTAPEEVSYRQLVHEKHNRRAMAFSLFVFTLLGFPLSIKVERSEKSAQLGIAFFLSMGWYVLVLLGKALSIGGAFPVVISAWMPNVILGAVGVYLIHQTGKT